MFYIYLSMRKSFQHQISCSVLRVILKIASCIMLRVGIIETQCFQLLWRHQPLKLEQVLFYNCPAALVSPSSLFGNKKENYFGLFSGVRNCNRTNKFEIQVLETIWPKIFMQQQWQHRQALMRPSRAISQQIMKCP